MAQRQRSSESMESDQRDTLYRKDVSSYRDFRDTFIRFAVAKDLASMKGMIDPGNSNPETVTNLLRSEVIPFFAGSGETVGAATWNIITDPSGNPGYTFYGYVKNDRGSNKPYAIAIVEKQGRLLVNNIIVGRCFPSFQPECS
jgi:hypothetical protein